ncbi:voltage-gated chloride channel family protein [Xanthocytophaga agilis]|uniref:voltage-gated chloride channel family protein n=1 Tax=Xanthocytophaga agilis TaxID=3048010 RepID=UPI0028D28672|nr:voltage-gated chloride channel family protein [Xanthocytophaga agilis]
MKKEIEQLSIIKHLLKWTVLLIPLACITGTLVALFLWLLDKATFYRWHHSWVLYFLPIAGIFIHFLYKFSGKNAEAGNNLIMDEIHNQGGGVPARMAPLVLVSTIITHLFGGSAGREGTAVQMGGSMANLLGRWFGLGRTDIRILLLCGIAAGFGAVFGTPVTGAIFAMEVLVIGRIRYDALIPCLIAGIFSDVVCSAWGIHHTHYSISYQESSRTFLPYVSLDFLLIGKVIVSGIFFGLAAYIFAELSHTIKQQANRFVSQKWLIPVIGGILIIGLTWLLGTDDYLGLGVMARTADGSSIINAFHLHGVTTWSWLWKLIFTAITLGMGFKGGEVTPLFFIGAALGNTLAVWLGAPVDLLAGLGFIAVFAGATNTPLACTLMGVELFGGEYILYYCIVCFTAYYFSGHSGIYQSQRIAISKTTAQVPDEEKTLKYYKHTESNPS